LLALAETAKPNIKNIVETYLKKFILIHQQHKIHMPRTLPDYLTNASFLFRKPYNRFEARRVSIGGP